MKCTWFPRFLSLSPPLSVLFEPPRQRLATDAEVDPALSRAFSQDPPGSATQTPPVRRREQL
ncbi:MAG: hypothetical protein ACLU9S_22785 [Oscillospiraceae bacterium]